MLAATFSVKSSKDIFSKVLVFGLFIATKTTLKYYTGEIFLFYVYGVLKDGRQMRTFSLYLERYLCPDVMTIR